MNNKLISAGILGIGSSVPDRILTNSDFEKMVDTSDEWIIQRTGISERRVLDKDTPAYSLGAKAAKKALESAGITPEQVDLILVSTNSPDYLVPSTACLIQKEICAVNAAAMDLNAACSGFIYGIATASQYIATGFYKYVLMIGCEALSKVTDYEDRNTCVLFGDAAGAVVLGPVEDGNGVLGVYMAAQGHLADNITIPSCYIEEKDEVLRPHENKRVLYQNGKAVFKFAVKAIDSSVKTVVEKAGLTLDDIKYIIPHQANQRIIEAAATTLGVPEEKVVSIIKEFGNTSSASIPLALDQTIKANKISKGDNIVMVGFGGGLTMASAVIKWCI